MNQTANYGLSQWEATDRILMEDFNNDNAAIDAALAAHDGDIAALEAAVAGKGNCKIWTTSYVGTGKYGAAVPNSLIFPWNPDVVLIVSTTGRVLHLVQGCSSGLLIMGNYEQSSTVTWGDKSVSWYSTQDLFGQMNETFKYYVLAFALA